MRILLLTIGTRGDVQPYVALAKGLIAAGHEATICTSQHHEAFIASHGVECAPINNDLIEFMHSDDGRLAMETTTNLIAAIRTGIRLWPKVTEMNRRQINEMWRPAESYRPDLIVFHKKAIGAEDFAEKLSCRCALGFYLPMYEPTSQFPAVLFPRLPLGGWYNRGTYRIIDWVTRKSSAKFVRPWREAQGLEPSASRCREYADGTRVPSLHAYSRHVIPRPSDWPDTATVTGYWFLDEPLFVPPQELTNFLAAGPTPIYVGFGSIFGRDPVSKAKVVVEGVRQSGARAILAAGWGGLDLRGIDLPETMLLIESAPHDWLFPRVAAVVHHGGCGTTAAGLRAGRPTIVCPFFGDQPFWGDIVHRLGVGPSPIMQRRLTAERLAGAIRTTLNDVQMKSKAAEIGRQLRSEKGVANAVAFLESLQPTKASR